MNSCGAVIGIGYGTLLGEHGSGGLQDKYWGIGYGDGEGDGGLGTELFLERGNGRICAELIIIWVFVIND